MEITTFMGRARLAGTSLIVTIPNEVVKFEGIKEHDILKFYVRRVIPEKEEQQ